MYLEKLICAYSFNINNNTRTFIFLKLFFYWNKQAFARTPSSSVLSGPDVARSSSNLTMLDRVLAKNFILINKKTFRKNETFYIIVYISIDWLCKQ